MTQEKVNNSAKAKSKAYHDLTIRLVKLVNILLMAFPFAAIWYHCYADKLWVTFYMRGHWLVLFLYIFLYILIGRIYDAFKISYLSVEEIVFSQLLSILEVNVIIYIVAWLLIRSAPDVKPLLIVMTIQVLVSIVWCKLSQYVYCKSKCI